MRIVPVQIDDAPRLWIITTTNHHTVLCDNCGTVWSAPASTDENEVGSEVVQHAVSHSEG